VTTPSRLDSFLTENTGKSRAFIQEQIKLQRAQVNGSLCLKSSHRLKSGDTVSFQWVDEIIPSHLTGTPGDLDILFEDEFLLAINKAAGVIVHPGAGQKENTLVHHLLHYLNSSQFSELSSERPGIVHRLDQGTTGVLLVAKTERMQVLLSEMFKNRTIKKRYQAITYGKVTLSGTITLPIGRDRKDRKKMSSRTHKARTAITQWKSLDRFEHFSHVELAPQTGRTHQLRVHLSETGFPIVGDPTYGKGKPKGSSLALAITDWLKPLDHTLLHARSLDFSHPITTKHIKVVAPLPSDFTQFLSLLMEHDPCPA